VFKIKEKIHSGNKIKKERLKTHTVPALEFMQAYTYISQIQNVNSKDTDLLSTLQKMYEMIEH
jgi:hypothetical protein